MALLRLTSALRRISTFYSHLPLRSFSGHFDYPPDMPAPHRTANPMIQLSIRLSKASNIFDIYSILESPHAILTHITFALRLIARIIKANPHSKVQLLDKKFFDLISKLEQGIHELGNQEISDVSFCWRNYLIICKKDLLSKEGEEKFMKRIHELIDENAFLYRHLVSILYDLSFIGITSKKLDEAIANGLQNKNEIMNAAEIKQILSCCLKKERESAKRVIYLCLERLDSFEEERMDTMHAIILLQELNHINQSSQFYQLGSIITKICNIIEKRKSALTEFEVLTSIEFLAPRAPFKAALLKSLFEKIKLNLEKDPGGFTKWFIIGVLRVVLNIDKYYCVPGLEELVVQDILGKIRNNLFPHIDIEEILTIYEKSRVIIPYEIGLAIQELKLAEKINDRWLLNLLKSKNVKVLDKNNQAVLLLDFIYPQRNI